MKRFFMIIVLLCASLITIAQDIIVKKDGSTIQSKIIQTNGTVIWYKEWSNQNGPVYSIDKSEVDSINYQNELITNQTDPQSMGSGSGKMERVGRNLILNGRKLSDEEVLALVGQENYETYLSAKKQIGVGRAFTPVFWLSLGATTALFITAEIYSDKHHIGNYSYTTPNAGLRALGYITGSIADVSLPLMCVFKGIGKGRMSWVADEYNRNKSVSAFSYQISPSIMKYNMMESHDNLGMGLTISLNF